MLFRSSTGSRDTVIVEVQQTSFLRKLLTWHASQRRGTLLGDPTHQSGAAMRMLSAAIVLLAGVALYAASGYRSKEDVVAVYVSIAGLVIGGLGLAVWLVEYLRLEPRG